MISRSSWEPLRPRESSRNPENLINQAGAAGAESAEGQGGDSEGKASGRKGRRPLSGSEGGQVTAPSSDEARQRCSGRGRRSLAQRSVSSEPDSAGVTAGRPHSASPRQPATGRQINFFRHNKKERSAAAAQDSAAERLKMSPCLSISKLVSLPFRIPPQVRISGTGTTYQPETPQIVHPLGGRYLPSHTAAVKQPAATADPGPPVKSAGGVAARRDGDDAPAPLAADIDPTHKTSRRRDKRARAVPFG